jgi:hypothetical protein
MKNKSETTPNAMKNILITNPINLIRKFVTSAEKKSSRSNLFVLSTFIFLNGTNNVFNKIFIEKKFHKNQMKFLNNPIKSEIAFV